MLDGNRIGNLLRRELHVFALKKHHKVYFTKQSSSKHEIIMRTFAFTFYIEETCCPPKRIHEIGVHSPIHTPTEHQTTPQPQTAPCPTAPGKRIKICIHSPIHTSDNTSDDSPPKTNQNLRTLTHSHIRRHLGRHPARQHPPKTNPKNLRTITPILEVRTPIAKAIWGKRNHDSCHFPNCT